MGGKPDYAGGPLDGSTHTWMLVYAEILLECKWEARHSGRPDIIYTLRFMEAGPRRRPHSIQPGSPTMQEAHWMDLHTNGSRSMPEAFWGVNGKPDAAGGPVINTLHDSWKPVHAGGHIVHIRGLG